jgi:hypothetical protein
MDEVDRQLDRDAPWDEAMIKKTREEAAKIPVGRPGDCDLCGEWSGRLVNGVCVPCRDLHKLP